MSEEKTLDEGVRCEVDVRGVDAAAAHEIVHFARYLHARTSPNNAGRTEGAVYDEWYPTTPLSAGHP